MNAKYSFHRGHGVVLVVVVVFIVVVHWPFACFVLDKIFGTSRSLLDLFL